MCKIKQMYTGVQIKKKKMTTKRVHLNKMFKSDWRGQGCWLEGLQDCTVSSLRSRVLSTTGGVEVMWPHLLVVLDIIKTYSNCITYSFCFFERKTFLFSFFSLNSCTWRLEFVKCSKTQQEKKRKKFHQNRNQVWHIFFFLFFRF